MNDTRKIMAACAKSAATGKEISDAAARMIASQHYEGQFTLGYAFVSTGAVPVATADLWRELFPAYDTMPAADRMAADHLGTYLVNVVKVNGWKARGPVAGWPDLWL
jgi:hypothetical protein